MRKAIVVSTLAVLAAISGSVLNAASVPRKAPEFVIEMPGGKQTLLSSYRGKTVVLAFMFTTCAHCQKAAPQLANLQNEYGSKGVQFLGATFDKDAKTQVEQFVRILGVNFPCGWSTEKNILTFLGLPPNTPVFVPIIIEIDKTGTIRTIHQITDAAKKDPAEEAFFNDVGAGVKADLDKMLKSGTTSAKK